ncbi:MBL fold metallo-hydrolase [Nonomuraea sp. LPB2021202275-12-8]|uniref:MBL fold metallo-hydrolase n=1 Tax=Nonomuraea sp. LPB2021202275-12-8 TaxID=3120159 RepID=UPI00300C8582
MENGTDEARLHEIAPGVFAWVQPDGTWWVNNAGAVTGDGGTVLVDTCATERRTRRFLGAVAEATAGAPVRMAVNTHQHGDHTYGNSLLPDETVIFGHELMRAALLVDPVIDGCPPFWAPVPDWGNVTRRTPAVVFSSELTLFGGGRRIELRHPGHAAHTPGDVVAWLPEERVLFVGDLLFHGLTPLVMMGSVDGALRSLDWLASFEPEHVVPGHGPLADAAALPGILAAHERYYRFVLEVARTGRQRGLTPLQAAQDADLGEFAGWADAERLVLNLHRAYAEAEGTEVDLITAFMDAMTWKGGPLPTSV